MPDSMTPAAVYAIYRDEKMAEEMSNDWSFIIYRVFSWLLTPLFMRLRIGPMPVTLAGLAIALCLPWLAARGGAAAWWQVGGAAFAVSLCDALDGDLARCTRRSSALGRYMDGQVDLIYRVAMYMAVGLMANESLGALGGLHAVGVTLVAVVLYLLGRLARQWDRQAAPPQPGDGPARVRITPLGLASGLDHLLPVLVLVMGWLGHVHWLVWWLLSYSALDFLISQYGALHSRS